MENEFKTWYNTKCLDKIAFRNELIKSAPMAKITFYTMLSKGIRENSKMKAIIEALMTKWES